MEGTNKKQPLFWINPNTRLNFPYFRIEWCFMPGTTGVQLFPSDDYSVLYIAYADDVRFDDIRLQSTLRVGIRDTVIKRASQVLPHRFHELENKHQLWAKSVTVKKLRKGVLGQCSHDCHIVLSPIIVILPSAMMDAIILHEMAHLKYHHHRKSFWSFLSTLLGVDAKEQNTLSDIVLSKYWELYVFLMK